VCTHDTEAHGDDEINDVGREIRDVR